MLEALHCNFFYVLTNFRTREEQIDERRKKERYRAHDRKRGDGGSARLWRANTLEAREELRGEARERSPYRRPPCLARSEVCMLHNRQTQQKEEQEENVNRWRVHVHTCKNGKKYLVWQMITRRSCCCCKKRICKEMTENIYRGERISKIWKEKSIIHFKYKEKSQAREECSNEAEKREGIPANSAGK